MGKDVERSCNFSGYALFTEDFYKKSSRKYKSLEAGNPHVKNAWDKLSEQQREEYCQRAKEQRPPTRSKKYIVPFYTRCAPKQFIQVILSTKDRLGKFDWSSYVLNELYKGIGVYKKQLEKGKLIEKKKNVPGCLYFLMIYCLQKFPLGERKASHVKHAVTYWDKKKVQQRVKEEKESNRGILHLAKQSTKFDPENLTHPREDKDEEEESKSEEEKVVKGSDSEDEEEDDRNEEDSESEDDRNEEEEQETHSEKKIGGQELDDEDKEVVYEDKEDEEENKREEKDEEDKEVHENNQGEGNKHVRKSTRVISKGKALRSPFLKIKSKAGKKRTIHDKLALFDMCTTRCNEEE
ncbi:glutamic acid-rich protein-like [Neltuma alba]|uniref:glutamic acid-rich protein-like n=1 Tax=Neltuma alba TaxID=207710 RepID=UPI0010A3B851|nr:glutamic acid-rich protein-like [Prosopis alba]